MLLWGLCFLVAGYIGGRTYYARLLRDLRRRLDASEKAVDRADEYRQRLLSWYDEAPPHLRQSLPAPPRLERPPLPPGPNKEGPYR